MSKDLQAILEAAKVSLEPHGRWLSKEHRSCEAVGRLLTSMESYISGLKDGHDRQVNKLTSANTELCKRSSEESAARAAAYEKLAKTEHVAIGRGMAQEDIPEATRNRILNVNGG